MSELLRIYDPEGCGPDGYPLAWHGLVLQGTGEPGDGYRREAIKDVIRAQAGYRCERCLHPYPPGIAVTCPRGEWTPCDTGCTHGEPVLPGNTLAGDAAGPHAQWRILTVHHLNGVKYDCRWWNLAALCQRCHLTIQGRVVMERVYPLEHSEWFKPHAAGWYAADYLGEELTREETMARLEELLALELQTTGGR